MRVFASFSTRRDDSGCEEKGCMREAQPPSPETGARQMSSEAFRDAASRLAAVASADGAIIAQDLTGTITSWNRAAEQLFGHTATEAIGRSIRLIVPENRMTEEADVMRRIRSGEKVEHLETERCRKDGALLDISLTVSPVRGEDGNLIGASKIARDITARYAN